MIAIINSLQYTVQFPYSLLITETDKRDLVSWGGDLCQLIQQLKAKNLSGNALQSEANRLFGLSGNESSFGDQDLYADLDAFGIYEIYKAQATKSLSTAVQSYYDKVTNTIYHKSHSWPNGCCNIVAQAIITYSLSPSRRMKHINCHRTV